MYAHIVHTVLRRRALDLAQLTDSSTTKLGMGVGTKTCAHLHGFSRHGIHSSRSLTQWLTQWSKHDYKTGSGSGAGRLPKQQFNSYGQFLEGAYIVQRYALLLPYKRCVGLFTHAGELSVEAVSGRPALVWRELPSAHEGCNGSTAQAACFPLPPFLASTCLTEPSTLDAWQFHTSKRAAGICKRAFTLVSIS